MNLVHKKNIVLVEVGQQRRQIPRLLNRRPGGNPHIDPHLIGNNARQRSLPQPRRAMEQHMVQRLLPHLGSLDKDLQIALGLLLTNVLFEGLWPE